MPSELHLNRFTTFLQWFWKDNSEEEALSLWQQHCRNFTVYTEELLESVDTVLASPPDHLIELLNEHGWVILYHDNETEDEYTFAEYVEWLRAKVALFREVLQLQMEADALEQNLAERLVGDGNFWSYRIRDTGYFLHDVFGPAWQWSEARLFAKFPLLDWLDVKAILLYGRHFLPRYFAHKAMLGKEMPLPPGKQKHKNPRN